MQRKGHYFESRLAIAAGLWRTAILHFDMGYSESTFSKYAFGRRGSQKKSTLCTLVKMMTILDDPLVIPHSDCTLHAILFSISSSCVLCSLSALPRYLKDCVLVKCIVANFNIYDHHRDFCFQHVLIPNINRIYLSEQCITRLLSWNKCISILAWRIFI